MFEKHIFKTGWGQSGGLTRACLGRLRLECKTLQCKTFWNALSENNDLKKIFASSSG